MAQPIYKTKNGQFSAAIFENEKGKSVALQKSFRQGSDWKNQSITLFEQDIDSAIEVLKEAQKNLSAPSEEGAEVSSENSEEGVMY